MNDTLRDVTRWADRGDRIAIALVVGAVRSAPRPLGTKMAINDRDEISGSSSPCVPVPRSSARWDRDERSPSEASDCSAQASCLTSLLDSQHQLDWIWARVPRKGRALSILAEVVAVRHGHQGVRLGRRHGRMHAAAS